MKSTLVVLLLVTSSCAPQPGDKCSEPRVGVCLNSTTWLLCSPSTSRWQQFACPGSSGCRSDPNGTFCDFVGAQPGARCPTPADGILTSDTAVAGEPPGVGYCRSNTEFLQCSATSGQFEVRACSSCTTAASGNATCQLQAGCTAENCRVMSEACRVDFQGAPSGLVTATCLGPNRPVMPIDYSKYCVDACNARPGRGAAASCFARNADRCRNGAAGQVIAECTPVETGEPEASCAAQCNAEQTDCDTICSGGRACDTCLRMGGACAAVCTSTSRQVCLDCGSSCGLSWLACVNRCPRAP